MANLRKKLSEYLINIKVTSNEDRIAQVIYRISSELYIEVSLLQLCYIACTEAYTSFNVCNHNL